MLDVRCKMLEHLASNIQHLASKTSSTILHRSRLITQGTRHQSDATGK